MLIASTAFFIGWRIRDWSPIKGDVASTYKLVSSESIYPLDESKAISAIVESIGDDHSYYLDSETYQRILEEDKGIYKGIGILYTFDNKKLKVIEVIKNTPAQKAGIVSGDEIISIEGKKVDDFENIFEISKILKGKDTGNVSLTILTKDEVKDLVIQRTQFELQSISYDLLENNIHYIKIYRFTDQITPKLSEILKNISNEVKPKVIIDLQNNPGGLTEEMIFVANQFINKGVLLKEKSKEGKETITNAVGKAIFQNAIVVVLINEETSSAAEQLAASMIDNSRALLVGKKTYGKGVYGNIYELDNGAAIHLTTGEWFRPNGESVQKIGIEPDIYSENPLNTALEQLK